MSEVYSESPLPEDVRAVIEAPLVPFEELEPYDREGNLYELGDRRGENGQYEVHLLMRKIGEETILLTRVESEQSVFELATPSDKGLDHLTHTFPTAPEKEIQQLFGQAA
jgi:hypothetical protein